MIEDAMRHSDSSDLVCMQDKIGPSDDPWGTLCGDETKPIQAMWWDDPVLSGFGQSLCDCKDGHFHRIHGLVAR